MTVHLTILIVILILGSASALIAGIVECCYNGNVKVGIILIACGIVGFAGTIYTMEHQPKFPNDSIVYIKYRVVGTDLHPVDTIVCPEEHGTTYIIFEPDENRNLLHSVTDQCDDPCVQKHIGD